MKLLYLFFIVFFLSSCVTQKVNIQKSDDHHKIAIGLLKSCDKPRALSHLLRAIRLNPKDFIVRNTLAVTYYSMKEYKKAVSEYKKLLKLKPDLTEARVDLARIYIDLNQLDQALKQIKTAEEDITYTGYLKLIVYKALANYKKEKYIQAKKGFDEALSLRHGKNCFNYIYFGKTEMALGNLDSAKTLLNKAVLQCKKDKPLCESHKYEELMGLGELYIKKRNKKKAKYYLKLFLKKTKEKEKIEEAQKLLKEIS